MEDCHEHHLHNVRKQHVANNLCVSREGIDRVLHLNAREKEREVSKDLHRAEQTKNRSRKARTG